MARVARGKLPYKSGNSVMNFTERISSIMSYGNRDRYRGGGGGRGGYGSGGYGGGSRYGSSSSSNFPKPVEMGKEYDVEVTEVSRKGDGVAKIQNFVIFVKEGKVGQKVRIKVESVGPRFAVASIVGGSSGKSAEKSAPATEGTEQQEEKSDSLVE